MKSFGQALGAITLDGDVREPDGGQLAGDVFVGCDGLFPPAQANVGAVAPALLDGEGEWRPGFGSARFEAARGGGLGWAK